MLIPREATLRGIYVGSRRMFEDMIRAIVVNGIRPAIDRTFDFEQAQDAYRHTASASQFGKIVMRIG